MKDPFDPTENVRGGVAYLRHLLDRYENNETLALAAYNAGPGAVDKYGQSVPPYRETRNYVAQINQMSVKPIAMRDKTIYKVTETIDGRPIVRYTDKKPTAGSRRKSSPTAVALSPFQSFRPLHRHEIQPLVDRPQRLRREEHLDGDDRGSRRPRPESAPAGPKNIPSANHTMPPAIAPGSAMTTKSSQVAPSMMSRCPIASSPRAR